GGWDAAGQSISDAQKTAADLIKNPGATVQNYLDHHWVDLLAGTAITLINPRGLSNAALFAYASRGVWMPAGSAMIQAVSDNADTRKISADLRLNTKHEL